MPKTAATPKRDDSSRRGAPQSARTAYLLSRLGRSQSARFAERLEPFGLGPKHFALLNAIEDEEGCSQQQLGERLALEPSGLVKTIDELEAQAIVERRRDPSDRRRHAVYLTAGGKETLRQARRAVAQRAQELLAPLDRDELKVLHDLLERLAEADGPGPA
jgi:DNA-binding MarR family transcriptional regulator